MPVQIAKILPKLEIHSWGGLGSQLFAALVALRVKAMNSYRVVCLVIHTSGVTKRNNELSPDNMKDIIITEKNDYTLIKGNSSHPKQSQLNLRLSVRRLFRRILGSAKIVVKLETPHEIKRYPIYTVSIRDHYTNIKLTEAEVDWIANFFKIELRENVELQSKLSIHYRLGDLISLESKTYIDPRVIHKLLLSPSIEYTEGRIFTDSSITDLPSDVKDLVDQWNLELISTDAVSVVRSCFYSKIFVGTNSKISLWISILRCVYLKQHQTYLPFGMLNNLQSLLAQIEISSQAIGYQP